MAWRPSLDVVNTTRVAEIARDQRLQPGESEAIALAEENLLPVLLDEQRAVSFARSSGTRAVRTPMIYAKAKSLGLIPSVRDRLDLLRRRRFFLKDRDYEAILKIVGEL